MKLASLSAEQAPPISVPLRFFIAAPVFLALAALLLAMAGGNPFAEPHAPAQIAATHHVTLGFMAMAMLGALQQLLPVVIGSPMPSSQLVAWFTFLPLTAGATAKNATKTALLLSILSLAGAVALGMLLAGGYANGLPLPYARLANAHISLALGGWVLLLIIGVSYQVVPMFQLTPNYPKWATVWLAPALFSVLLQIG